MSRPLPVLKRSEEGLVHLLASWCRCRDIPCRICRGRELTSARPCAGVGRRRHGTGRRRAASVVRRSMAPAFRLIVFSRSIGRPRLKRSSSIFRRCRGRVRGHVAGIALEADTDVLKAVSRRNRRGPRELHAEGAAMFFARLLLLRDRLLLLGRCLVGRRLVLVRRPLGLVLLRRTRRTETHAARRLHRLPLLGADLHVQGVHLGQAEHVLGGAGRRLRLVGTLQQRAGRRDQQQGRPSLPAGAAPRDAPSMHLTLKKT